MRAAIALALVLLAGCNRLSQSDADIPSDAFPRADRPVAPIVSSRFSTEEARDKRREAELVMDQAGIRPGMTVADIGAGEGYYTVRLATRVGEKGRVVAEDILIQTRDALADRVIREALDNVSVKLGDPADPKLPAASFDRIFMVHMYHEIRRPYEFLWRMRPALNAGGQVIVVEADRPVMEHGTPAALLDCEFRAVGYRLAGRTAMPQVDGYLARYVAVGERPKPRAIRPCRLK